MRQHFQSIALIRRVVSGKNRWSARVNATNPHTLSFIAAHRLERDSFRDSIRREVGWVLGVDADRELLVSNMAQLNLEFVGRLPGDNDEKHIAVAFFMVELYGKCVLKSVLADPDNHWLSSPEVCAGSLQSGANLEPRLHFLLQRGKVINAWD